MNSYEYAAEVYKRLKLKDCEADRIAAIQSFLENEYNKGWNDYKRMIEKGGDYEEKG